jgi:hypothetical protein
MTSRITLHYKISEKLQIISQKKSDPDPERFIPNSTWPTTVPDPQFRKNNKVGKADLLLCRVGGGAVKALLGTVVGQKSAGSWLYTCSKSKTKFFC